MRRLCLLLRVLPTAEGLRDRHPAGGVAYWRGSDFGGRLGGRL